MSLLLYRYVVFALIGLRSARGANLFSDPFFQSEIEKLLIQIFNHNSHRLIRVRQAQIENCT